MRAAGGRRWRHWLASILALFLCGPALIGVSGAISLDADWRTANRDSVGLAPDPAATPEALIQLYAARAFNWRGLFAVHTWLATKAAGADHYVVHQVVGWNLRNRGTVVASGPDLPDRRWYDAEPQLLAELRGAPAAALIEQVAAAVVRYPYAAEYGLWPGPNSNTFIAFVLREVPGLGFELPATAIGKDYLGDGTWVARAPSGTGMQASLGGVLGVLAARSEGLELNLFGAVFGLDPLGPAVKLPGLGRVGFAWFK